MSRKENVLNLKYFLNHDAGFITRNGSELRIEAISPRKERFFKRRNFKPELELWINSKRFGAIVFKKTLSSKIFENTIFRYRDTPYRFILLCSEDYIMVHDKYGSIKSTEKTLNYNQAIDFIKDNFNDYKIQEHLNSVKKSIQKRLEKTESLKDQSQVRNIADKYLNKISYSVDNNEYQFVGMKDEKIEHPETQFMLELLGNLKDNCFYRYTSMKNLVRILQDKTYRMNGIAGMNDLSEMTYADSILINESTISMDTNLNKFLKINRKFISSCSSAEDDLTMWRLYGDGSKGVCIELRMTNDYLNSTHPFVVAPISYAKNSDGDHPELDVLKAFVHGTDDAGEVFGLIDFDTWKHFFKPYEYHIEKEVRILYFKPNKEGKEVKWNTSSFGSINPFVTFSFEDSELPFKLNKITLGPCSPEKILNYHQLRSMVSPTHLGLDEFENIDIEVSKIEHYRTE